MDDDNTAKMEPVRAVLRAIDILKSFSPDQPAMSVSELHKRVKLSRPTLYRLLYTLQVAGLIKPGKFKHLYELDYGVMQIARSWLQSSDIMLKAEPTLERLWVDLNETVALMVPQGHYRVCVIEKAGRQALSYSRGVGDVDHLAETASGRAILAHLSPTTIAAVLLERKREAVALQHEIDRIQRAGYATSGGTLEGIVGVAAPVLGPDAIAIASVSATGPEARFSGARLENCIAQVRKAADDLSVIMGHR